MLGIAPGAFEQVDQAVPVLDHWRGMFFLGRQRPRLVQQRLRFITGADQSRIAAKRAQGSIDQESAGRVEAAQL